MTARSETTRLFVEGVQTAIRADLVRRRGDGLVVSQALPFLRLGTSVRESDGSRARIARVAIAMDGDVPRLLLELVSEDHDGLAAPALRRAPMQAAEAPAVRGRTASLERIQREDDTTPDLALSTRPARTDSTVPYDLRVSRSTEERTEIVVGALVPRSAPRPTLFARVMARAANVVASLGRRAVPAG
jgi:hypothetical protein